MSIGIYCTRLSRPTAKINKVDKGGKMLSRDLHMKTVYKKVVVMFTCRKKAKYIYTPASRGDRVPRVFLNKMKEFFLFFSL